VGAAAWSADGTQFGLLGITRNQVSRTDRSNLECCYPTTGATQEQGRVQLALLASCGGKRWVVEYAGPVLDELDAAVEGSAIDHVERDVGVAVVDAF
jgi:hypothetical protein